MIRVKFEKFVMRRDLQSLICIMKTKTSPFIKVIAVVLAVGAFAAPEVKAQSFWDLIFGRNTTTSPPRPTKPPVASKFDLKLEVAALDRASGELLTSFRNDIQSRPGAHKGHQPSYGHSDRGGKGKGRVNPKRQLMLQQITAHASKVDALVLATNRAHGPDVALIKKSLPSICENLAVIGKIQPEVKTSAQTDALIKRNTILATKVNKEAAHLKVRPVIKPDALALDRLSAQLLLSYQNDVKTVIHSKGRGQSYGNGQSYGRGQGHGKGHSPKGNPRRQLFMKQIVDYNAQVDKLVVITGYPHSTKHPALKKVMHEICASLEAIEKYQTEVKTSETTAALIKRNSLLATKINKVTTRY